MLHRNKWDDDDDGDGDGDGDDDRDYCTMLCMCVCVCVCADATEFGRESNMALDDMSSDQVLEAVKTLSQKSAWLEHQLVVY